MAERASRLSTCAARRGSLLRSIGLSAISSCAGVAGSPAVRVASPTAGGDPR